MKGETLYWLALCFALFMLGFRKGEQKTMSMAYPITVTAPHDTTSILIRFAGDELHYFILE